MAPSRHLYTPPFSATKEGNHQNLIEALRGLPPDTLGRLRHLQPQVGCPNRCSFCSQQAQPQLFEFSRETLVEIIAALKVVGIEQAIRKGRMAASRPDVLPEHGLIAHQTSRPGVVYLYLDNDPAFYPHLDLMVKLLYQELGVRSRISTSGFSRYDQRATQAFTSLAKSPEMLAGIRLSLTPYIIGFSNSKITSRQQFKYDLAHTLSTLKSFLLNPDDSESVVEVRFPPLVIQGAFQRIFYKGMYAFACCGYLVASKNNFFDSKTTTLTSTAHRLTFNSAGTEGFICQIHPNETPEAVVTALEKGQRVAEATYVHRFENEDGEYFGVNVERQGGGMIRSKYFYPRTISRPDSGCVDAERYFLNAILKFQQEEGVSCLSMDTLVRYLKSKAVGMRLSMPKVASYLAENVIPLVELYSQAISMAGFDPLCLFKRSFTVDTGHICNLGLGYHEYNKIASRKDLPLTPHHERAFGAHGDLAQEGVVYRLAPGFVQRASAEVAHKMARYEQCITIEQLDLAKTSTRQGQSRVIYNLSCQGIIQRFTQIIPGQIFLSPFDHSEEKFMEARVCL